MQIKRKLTEVAVDSFTEYLHERFSKLKELDLDQDGQKDVDQIMLLLSRCGEKAKETLSATNIANIASGLDQIIQGASLVRKSFDEQKVGELIKELSNATSQIAKLAQLSIKYAKEQGKSF